VDDGLEDIVGEVDVELLMEYDEEGVTEPVEDIVDEEDWLVDGEIDTLADEDCVDDIVDDEETDKVPLGDADELILIVLDVVEVWVVLWEFVGDAL